MSAVPPPRPTSWRPRLLPAVLATLALLLVLKAEALWHALPAGQGVPVAARPGGAVAAEPARPPSAPVPAPTSAAAIPGPAEADPVPAAERALLEQLRDRRAQIDSREETVAGREVVLAAAERRLAGRVAELEALRQRLEALERSRGEREDAGWRGLVKVYETMRPRDAAAIFDELELPVLVQVVDRMREAKASPVLGAMRPDRARLLTTELARHRGRAVE